MPRSTECCIAGRKGVVATIAEAIKLGPQERRNLICIECGQRVSPHRESRDGSQPADFEHVPSDGGRNAKCSKSDPAR
jgi:hypothetical protein